MNQERKFSRREVFKSLVKGIAALSVGGCTSNLPNPKNPEFSSRHSQKFLDNELSVSPISASEAIKEVEVKTESSFSSLELESILKFYNDSNHQLDFYEILSQKEKIVPKIKEFWDPKQILADGSTLYGGLLKDSEIDKLPQNFPEGWEIKALFIIKSGDQEDVFVEARNQKGERIYLRLIALVVSLEKPKLATWAYINGEELVVWNPEVKAWNFYPSLLSEDGRELSLLTNTTYIVRSGDTLFEIAKRYNLSIEEILRVNPQIKNPNLIKVGQEVNLPLNVTSGILMDRSFNSENGKVILSVPIDAQDFSLSCESSASAMVATYFKPEPPEGFNNWEEYFVKTIPLDCNPHKGFRGKIDGYLSTRCEPPNGYGVYAEPVATALNNAGIQASVEYGVDYLRVAQAVRSGYPVIVWVSNKKAEPEYEIDPETGEKYLLLLGEHVWVVTGVSADNKSFLINDPWRGRQFWCQSFPRWEEFGGMRVIVKGKEFS
jgi:LysM repeat protein